jgi:hypothetical protein
VRGLAPLISHAWAEEGRRRTFRDDQAVYPPSLESDPGFAQCVRERDVRPLAIGPTSMNANAVSLSRSLKLFPIHQRAFGNWEGGTCHGISPLGAWAEVSGVGEDRRKGERVPLTILQKMQLWDCQRVSGQDRRETYFAREEDISVIKLLGYRIDCTDGPALCHTNGPLSARRARRHSSRGEFASAFRPPKFRLRVINNNSRRCINHHISLQSTYINDH